MPLESLQTLQHLDITGPAGSDQHEAQYESVAGNESPARTSHPLAPAPAPQPASQAHLFEQTHSPPFYPPLINPFAFDTNSAIPVDPGLVAARDDHLPTSGSGGGVASFQQTLWTPQSATAASMDSFMVSPTSLPQYNSSMPLVPGMSSFEPMVSTAWSMDGSLPSSSASRGPTLSSTLSVHGTSTPASSQSPGSPRKVRSGKTEPRAVSKKALPNQIGTHAELRAEDQPNRNRRQSSGLKAQPKTSADKKDHQNNSSPNFSTPQALIAPAPIAAANTSDDDDNNKGNGSKKTNSKKNDNNNSSSPNHHHHHQPMTTTTTTTKMTSEAPSQPPQPSLSSQADPRARNRAAANRCRAKSKVAVAELEAAERAMGAEHEELTRTARTLRDEVLLLKNELLMHGNCDDDVIQQYLANSARMVGRGVVTRR